MTANDSKSYLSYPNRLGDQYNNSYHRSIGKKPPDADYSALKLLNLKLVTEPGLLSTNIFLTKVLMKIGQEKYLQLIVCWKLTLAYIN